jgi:hypothetical protein
MSNQEIDNDNIESDQDNEQMDSDDDFKTDLKQIIEISDDIISRRKRVDTLKKKIDEIKPDRQIERKENIDIEAMINESDMLYDQLKNDRTNKQLEKRFRLVVNQLHKLDYLSTQDKKNIFNSLN